jgi:hypothetical protein
LGVPNWEWLQVATGFEVGRLQSKLLVSLSGLVSHGVEPSVHGQTPLADCNTA